MYFIERESFIIILNYWLVSLLLYLQTIWNTIILSILWKRRVRKSIDSHNLKLSFPGNFPMHNLGVFLDGTNCVNRKIGVVR